MESDPTVQSDPSSDISTVDKLEGEESRERPRPNSPINCTERQKNSQQPREKKDKKTHK